MIGRKSSLLPVKPGTSSAGRRSHTPVAGIASNAANRPRAVFKVNRRTPAGTSTERGVLTGGHPTDLGVPGIAFASLGSVPDGLAGLPLAAGSVLATAGAAADPAAGRARPGRPVATLALPVLPVSGSAAGGTVAPGTAVLAGGVLAACRPAASGPWAALRRPGPVPLRPGPPGLADVLDLLGAQA